MEMEMRKRNIGKAGMAMALAFGMSASYATEGGGSTYVAGADNYLMGAVPPPGLYILEFGNFYTADQLKDANGNNAPIPDFKVQAVVAATRVVWSTPLQLLGGNVVVHSIFPLVNLTVKAGGMSQTKTGLGDITFGPGLVHHYSENLHDVIGVDFVAPTGGYRLGDLANIGHNYWSIQPLYTMSYINASGFNGDFKATLNINQKNTATNYQSGTEFILDYAAGYAVAPGWVAGVSGYWYQQLSSDTQGGVTVPDSKGRGFAIGPSVKFDNGKGWFLTAKVQKEFAERNRTQGTAVWLKTRIMF